MKILVAEDDAIMLASITHQLKQEGFNVISANNGREAIQIFENDKADLIITDIMMPFTSGLEFLNIIRNRSDSIPVLVLSALDEEDTVLEAFNLGANDFLIKPIKPGELSLKVNRLLKKYK